MLENADTHSSALAESNKVLSELAHLAQVLTEKRVLCTKLRRQLEILSDFGQVVTGEQTLLQELEQLVGQELKLLETIAHPDSSSVALAALAGLRETQKDVRWDLAQQLHTEWEGRVAQQRTANTTYRQQVKGARARLEALRADLDKVRLGNAPIREQEIAALRMDDMISQAERALDDPSQFGLPTSLMPQIADIPQQAAQLTIEIEQKFKQVRPFLRQAQLLLLQLPEDAESQLYSYTVLMRTASEPGMIGINIQGSSIVAAADRERIGNITAQQITSAVAHGLARQFEEARGSPAGGAALSEKQDAGAGGAELGGAPPVPGELRDIGPDDPENTTAIDVNKMVQDVGDLMYRLCVPEQMQAYLNTTPCSLTITTNDLELPWELITYRKDDGEESTFLCLERPVARMLTGQTFPRHTHSRVNPKLRFLLIYSDPTGNLPAARNEIDLIEQALKTERSSQIEIVALKNASDATGAQLTAILRDGAFDVIHYAGHARFDPKDAERSGLLLYKGEVLLAQKIRRLLEGRPLVFLNACESGRTANELAPQKVQYLLQAPAAGLASAFIYGGALGCIGSLWSVYDRPAAEFAIEFYRRVLDGHMIGEAMRLARIESRKAYPRQITWASFVLYGDPTFRLA